MRIINELRYQPDWVSLCVCVALAVGSRLIEILRVSTYVEVENPLYIRVEGVAKDRADREIKGGEEKKDDSKQLPPNKRIFVKPIVGGILSGELIDMVNSIRDQLNDRYNLDERHLTRKQLTALVDAKLNVKVREVLGEGFVLHDCRSLYAHMAWAQYGNQEGQSQTYFFSQVLGHHENSLNVSLGYQKFAIKRQIKQDDPDLVSKITTLQEEVRGIQKLKDSLSQTLARAKAINRPNDSTEGFINNKGEVVEIKKQARVRDGNKEARMARLEATAKSLEEKGITTTARNLLRLGFGSRIVNEWKKKNKK